ncbi:hypothetical protein GOV08_02790, partial [Candidatus Woesearchaeota archaeon]|nr:hypothetical protein [Candidatus Woesearchaeota archaeon]
TLGGCWQGYTTLTDNTVGNVLNEEYFDDLLYANDSFHYCKFEPPQSICRVDTSCNAGEVEALYLSSLTNAHADTSSYSNKLCCDQNQFNNINLTNIYLSSDFNAHVDVTGDVGYGTNVSIGSSTGYAECRLSTKGVCDSGWSSLFSLSSETNAHIGEPYNYSLNYCCKVAGTISFDNYVKYDNPLVTEQGACAIPGTRAFCDNTNTWSTEKVQDLNNNEVDLKRNAIKTINSSSPRMREYASSGNTAGCCPDSYCWDGERCIDGTGSDTVSLDIVYDLEGSNNINDTGLVCSNGVWVKTEAKFTPHHDEFSYCSLNSQCYFNEGFNTRCYNGSGSGAFVDGYDFFCDNGDWSSRTKLLADTLFNIDKNGNTYSIFCDDTNLVLIQEITDVSNVPHAINEVGANKDEGWNWASVCVLAIDEDGNSQFGNPGDTVIIGVPLEDGWENLDSANFWNFADTCSDPAGILDNGNTYVQCTPNIWYNNFTNTIIFSEEDISNYMSPLLAGGSLLSKLIDWFTDFINLGKRVSNWLDFQELIHAREFTYKNILYNHIYYFEDGSNYIAGVKEFNLEKNNDAYYIIYTKYVGFTGLETCSNITIDGVPQFLTTSFTSSNYNKITCDTTSNVIIQEYKADEIDDVFWPDLTARLRPK